jgi:LuxR family maltose regulon positive regulatory protein
MRAVDSWDPSGTSSIDSLRWALTGVLDALDHDDVAHALHHARALLTSLEARLDVPPAAVGPSSPSLLTERELDALRLLNDGAMSQKDIARTLDVTLNTVKSHVQSIYLKLGTHTRSEAVQLGRQLGLVPPATIPHERTSPPPRFTLVPGSQQETSV